MKNDDFYDKIDDYLLGYLSAKEQTDFEQEMANSRLLQQEVEGQRDLLNGIAIVGKENLVQTIEDVSASFDLEGMDIPVYGSFSDDEMKKGITIVGKEQVKEELTQIENELEKKGFFETAFQTIEQNKQDSISSKTASLKTAKVHRLKPWKSWLAIAASIALITVMGWFIFQPNSISGPVATHFEPATDVMSTKLQQQLGGIGMATNDMETQLKALIAGMEAFKQKNYPVAIEKLSLEKLAFLSSRDRQLLKFYLGQSYLGAGEYKQAISTLEPLAANALFSKQMDAKWYLLLAYLEMGEEDKAEQLKGELREHVDYRVRVERL